MLAIEIELLGGRYVATAHNDRFRAEWPPHPARLFSALVAVLYERGDVDPAERDALLWLEAQPPPELAVALDGLARRDVKAVFVPVNDVRAINDLEKPLRDARKNLEKVRAGGRSAIEVQEAESDVRAAEKKLNKGIAGLAQRDAAPGKKVVLAAGALLPERRTRKVRTFPVAIPSDPTFAFAWPGADGAHHRPALQRLCGRVTRLGHSSSLVRCTISERTWTSTLVPTETHGEPLRTIGPGQLQRLDDEFERHQGIEPRNLPSMTHLYAPPRGMAEARELDQGAFSSDWIVFERVGGARLLSSRGQALARAVRAALLEMAGELAVTLPATLCGHAGSTPTDAPHVAFVSLVHVGFPHADASVQGVAIVLPRDLSANDRALLVRLVATLEERRSDAGVLTFAGKGLPEVLCQREPFPTKHSTRPSTWCRPSSRFVTAVPIALDRNPGNLRSNLERTAHRAALEAQRTIADACVLQGLSRPSYVEVDFNAFTVGAQPARAFAARWKQGATARVRVHADIEFPTSVRGPLLLGATRYFGEGLCLPVRREGDRGGER